MYEGSDEQEELKTVPIVNQNNNNNNNNVVSDSNSDSDDKNEEKVFDKDIVKEVKTTPKITVNAKVVHLIKTLQALYNDDANKIIKQTAKKGPSKI